MWSNNLGRLSHVQGSASARDQAVPVVSPQGYGVPTFGRINAVILDEAKDLGEGIDESDSRWDDLVWGRVVMLPFTWQWFTNWWVSRRWVMPRDVRRR